MENSAQITSADLLRAQALWAKHSSAPFRTLLDAQEDADAAEE